MIINKNTVETKYQKLYDLNNESIGIPIFQRFYAWKPDQINQLLSDIVGLYNAPNNQIYLLDFIFYNDGEKIMIADGQQRLVTINNLIKAIKDVATEKSISIDDISYFNIEYDIPDNQTKYETHFNQYPTSPFKSVYLSMKDFVEQNIKHINEIISIIKNNIFIYMKKCANGDDAFLIFQQINTGGKPLSKDEVIKTAIDQYAKVFDINFSYKKIKDVRQTLISYYKFKTNNQNKNFDNMEIITFLKDYVTKNKKTFREFAAAARIISGLSNNPLTYVINYINRAILHNTMNIIALKGIDIEQEQSYKTKVIIPLCLASIILSIKTGNPSSFKYLNDDIINMIKRNQTTEDIHTKIIETINDDQETWTISKDGFIEALGNPDTKLRKLKEALLILDVIISNASGLINVPKINLEHIYPQHPAHEWAAEGWPTNQDEQKKWIDNIGNYLLLCEEVNKRIKNKYITEKVEKYRTIIDRDRILQTRINKIDFDKFINEQMSYISERQKEIAKSIRDTFPLGRVLIKG